MPVPSRILGILAMTLALPLAVWLGHYSRWSDTAAGQKPVLVCGFRGPPIRDRSPDESDAPPPNFDSWRPSVARQPPYPKILVEEELFNFGTAPPGETKSHDVCIQNIGEAPLLLVKPPSGWSQGWRRTLQVGETFEYEFFWTPSDVQRCFSQGVVLFTNDPQRPQVEMAVFGRVGYRCPLAVGNGGGTLP